MYQNITTASGYSIHEYLLLLSPTGELWHRLLSLKKDFAKRYKAWFAFYTQPHISLVKFLAYAQTEQRIIDCFKTIGMGITPFNIELKNFGAFETSNTIFVNVETKTPIQGLVQELKQARQLLKLNKGYAPIFVDNPHLSVCRGLSAWQFESGWSEYSGRSFNGSFPANHMTLLKRAYKENKYATAGQFTFQSTPSLPKQGFFLCNQLHCCY